MTKARHADRSGTQMTQIIAIHADFQITDCRKIHICENPRHPHAFETYPESFYGMTAVFMSAVGVRAYTVGVRAYTVGVRAYTGGVR
ncbi:MAG: hypothetical protein LBT42_08235, partial [Tannerella sp.]|nr:hypothetical protein [Tannerella sp.]